MNLSILRNPCTYDVRTMGLAACSMPRHDEHYPNSSTLFLLTMPPLTVPLRRSAIRYVSVASKVTTAHFRDVISGVAESRRDMWKQIELTTRRHEELVASTTRRHDELVLTTANHLFWGLAAVLGGLATVLGGFIVLDQKIDKLNDKIVEGNEKVIKEIKEFIAESNKKKSI